MTFIGVIIKLRHPKKTFKIHGIQFSYYQFEPLKIRICLQFPTVRKKDCKHI